MSVSMRVRRRSLTCAIEPNSAMTIPLRTVREGWLGSDPPPRKPVIALAPSHAGSTAGPGRSVIYLDSHAADDGFKSVVTQAARGRTSRAIASPLFICVFVRSCMA